MENHREESGAYTLSDLSSGMINRRPESLQSQLVAVESRIRMLYGAAERARMGGDSARQADYLLRARTAEDLANQILDAVFLQRWR